ncbi:MAG: exo-alpha-sialidase [Euryarchaeota archaeon]|nr:exo-alpha-sialidase [Euryarchaeota archaeon]
MQKIAVPFAIALIAIVPAYAFTGAGSSPGLVVQADAAESGPSVPASSVSGVNRLATVTLGPANEVDLAVNPTNALNIVLTAKDYSLESVIGPGGYCGAHTVWGGVYRTVDGGATWANTLFPGYPTDPVPSAASGYPCMSDPVLLFEPGGDLYFTGLLYGKPGPDGTPMAGMVFGASYDGGATWPLTTMAFEGLDDLAWEDKQMMAVDPTDGTIYVSWDLINSAVISPVISRSIDGGLTWVTNPIMPPAAWGALTQPAVGPDGTLYVSAFSQPSEPAKYPPGTIYLNHILNDWMITVWVSTDKGVTFVPQDIAVPVAQMCGSCGTSYNYRAPTIPTIAVDHSFGTNRGTVHVAWHSWETATNRWHVTEARSNDQGATWTMTQPGKIANQHQVMPRVATSPTNGTVGILYYNDAGTTAAPGLVTARFIDSFNGGAGWTPALTVSSAFSPAPMYHQQGFVFIGDYVGLDFDSGGYAHAGWADGRNGRSDVYYAKLNP